MKWLVVAGALVALVACDAPWAGPSMPDGARALSLEQFGFHGPFDTGPDIAASTSLAQVRDMVVAHALEYHPGGDVCGPYTGIPDPCWRQIADQPGRVYLAVVIDYSCNADTEESAAIGGNTLYFIHWVGNPRGPCTAAMAIPNWRLYSAAGSDLPSAGVLTVRLLFEGSAQGRVDTQVVLS